MEQTAWIPRRTLKGTQTSAKSLNSLEYFQVFILVNGQNSVEGIARLLRQPSEIISRILNDLRKAGLIE
jgi:predicted transcriptional regulator